MPPNSESYHGMVWVFFVAHYSRPPGRSCFRMCGSNRSALYRCAIRSVGKAICAWHLAPYKQAQVSDRKGDAPINISRTLSHAGGVVHEIPGSVERVPGCSRQLGPRVAAGGRYRKSGLRRWGRRMFEEIGGASIAEKGPIPLRFNRPDGPRCTSQSPARRQFHRLPTTSNATRKLTVQPGPGCHPYVKRGLYRPRGKSLAGRWRGTSRPTCRL